MVLHYRKYGDGPPLIILHGLFGSSDNWHTLANRWSKFYTVYAVDQRNHGSSPHESAMNYDEMASDLGQFMDQQRLDSAFIVGHSMGGKVALLFAATHPDKVNGLVALDIGIGRVEGQHTAILNALTHINPSEYEKRPQIKQALQETIGSPAIRQFLLKNIMRRIDGSLAWRFNREALLDHYQELTEELHLLDTFSGPVLFLRGELSNYLEETLTPEILQHFPFAQINTIEGAGHWLHAEKADEIYDQINDFLLEA